MAASQLELIVNQVRLLPPDELIELIKQAAEVLEQKRKRASAAPDAEGIDLQALGIDRAQAAELRASFATFEDWNAPEMDVYNDYGVAEVSGESYSFIGIGHSGQSNLLRCVEEIPEQEAE